MNDLLAALDEDQRRAAEALSGPVVILAGAGSGKTRTVTHRIAYGVATGAFDPKRTMALTFTTKAAGELGRRLDELGAGAVASRTFHSAAFRQLRYFWPDAIGGKVAKLVADKSVFVAQGLRSCGESADNAKVRAVVSEIEWYKAANLVPDNYQARPDGPNVDTKTLVKAFKAYEEVKSAHHVMDFEDVLLVTIGLLDSRSDIREEVRRTYRWFTIDEFQDVSPLQMRLLALWLGRNNDVCAVGDPAQSIYGFAGADSDFLVGFTRHFPEANVVELARSYRCSPPIIQAANRLARQIPRALTLVSAAEGQASAVQVLSFPDEVTEASGVAQEIAALVRGGREPGSIACLYRTNAQSAVLQAALQGADLEFAVRNSERFFARAEVREILTRLRGLARTSADLAAGEAVIEAMTAMGSSSKAPLQADRDRMESFRALEYLARDQKSVSDLVLELDRRESDNLAPPSGAVTLMTLHAAKGLEWSTVFVVGASEGLLPLVTERGQNAVTEERRLFYVGVTRAEERLVITWARHRLHNRSPNNPSRFLAELGAQDSEFVQGSAREAGGRSESVSGGVESRLARRPDDPQAPAACQSCGKSLVTGQERILGRCRTCPSSVNPSVLAELYDWRERRCAALGLPEYAVCTDAGLESVASALPQTLVELADLPGLNSQKVADHGEEMLLAVKALHVP